MIFFLIYLSIGLGFYVGVSIVRHYTFRNTTTFERIKGLIFGLIFWPIVMIFLYNNRYNMFGGDIVKDMEEDGIL